MTHISLVNCLNPIVFTKTRLGKVFVHKYSIRQIIPNKID